MFFNAESDFPFEKGDVIFVCDDGDGVKEFVVRSLSQHGRRLRVALEGISNRDDAAAFTNKIVYISKDNLKHNEDEYYAYQLVGLDVFDTGGKKIGIVDAIFSTGAHDIYSIKDGKEKELLLPAVAEFVKKIDLKGRRIVVHLIGGMEFK